MYTVYISYYETHNLYSEAGGGTDIYGAVARAGSLHPYGSDDHMDASERVLAVYPRGDIIDDASEINRILEPKVNAEMGKTGSFEFQMYPDNPYYDCLVQMMTMLRVTDGDGSSDDPTIFYGRVLTIDIDHLSLAKNVHCEGYLGVLMDSLVEGKPENEREKTTGKKYIDALIENHNSVVTTHSAEVDGKIPATIPTPKDFTVGAMPGHYSDSGVLSTNSVQRIKLPSDTAYGSTSWQDTMSAFSSLISDYGGYLRARYVNGRVYLDWLDMYFSNTNKTKKPIKVSQNVISLSSSSEVDNIFTYLIPIGNKEGKALYVSDYEFTPSEDETEDSDVAVYPGGNLVQRATSGKIKYPFKYLRVCDIESIGGIDPDKLDTTYHTEEEYLESCNRYGIIYKTVKFDNADTVDKLWQYAWDYIRLNYHGATTSITATALDLSLVESGYEHIQAGDQVKLTYQKETGETVTADRTVISIQYDLQNPENNQYTIGVPDGVLNNRNASKYGKSNGGSGSASQQSTTNDPGFNGWNDDINAWKEELERRIWAHFVDKAHNVKNYEEFREKYGDELGASIQKSAVYTLTQSVDHDQRTQAVMNTMVLDAVNGKITLNNPKLGPIAGLTDKIKDATNALRALIIDGHNHALTFNEQLAITKDNFTSFKKTPKPVIKMGLRGVAAPSNADDDADPDPETSPSAVPEANTGGFMKLFDVFKSGGTGTSTQKTAAVIDGVKATVATVKGLFMNNTGSPMDDAVEDPANNPASVEIDGSGQQGEGTVKVGRSGNRWRVLLNGSSQWQGTDGQWYTAPGFVIGDDFAIPDEIPSFSTKLAVIDTALIGTAYIEELNALKAKIQKITGAEVIAGTRIRTEDLRATEILAADIHLRHGADTSDSLWTAYYGLAKVENEDGTITLKGRLMDRTLDTNPDHWVTFSPAGTLSWEWGDGDLSDEDSLPINILRVTAGKNHEDFEIQHRIGHREGDDFIIPSASNQFALWVLNGEGKYEMRVQVYHNQHVIAEVPIDGTYVFNQGKTEGEHNADVEGNWTPATQQNQNAVFKFWNKENAARYNDTAIRLQVGRMVSQQDFQVSDEWAIVGSGTEQIFTKIARVVDYKTNTNLIVSEPIYGRIPFEAGLKASTVSGTWTAAKSTTKATFRYANNHGGSAKTTTVVLSAGQSNGSTVIPNLDWNIIGTGANQIFQMVAQVTSPDFNGVLENLVIDGSKPFNAGIAVGQASVTISGEWTAATSSAPATFRYQNDNSGSSKTTKINLALGRMTSQTTFEAGDQWTVTGTAGNKQYSKVAQVTSPGFNGVLVNAVISGNTPYLEGFADGQASVPQQSYIITKPAQWSRGQITFSLATSGEENRTVGPLNAADPTWNASNTLATIRIMDGTTASALDTGLFITVSVPSVSFTATAYNDNQNHNISGSAVCSVNGNTTGFATSISMPLDLRTYTDGYGTLHYALVAFTDSSKTTACGSYIVDIVHTYGVNRLWADMAPPVVAFTPLAAGAQGHINGTATMVSPYVATVTKATNIALNLEYNTFVDANQATHHCVEAAIGSGASRVVYGRLVVDSVWELGAAAGWQYSTNFSAFAEPTNPLGASCIFWIPNPSVYGASTGRAYGIRFGSVSYTADSNDANYQTAVTRPAYIYYDAADGSTQDVAKKDVSLKTVYDKGWKNAYSHVLTPVRNTSSAIATYKVPASEPGNVNTYNLYLTLTQSGTTATAQIHNGSDTGTVVAQKQLTVSSGSSYSISIGTPSIYSSSDGGATSPTGGQSVTVLSATNWTNKIKNNPRAYLYFKVTAGSVAKWYCFATPG